jgi:hypothetical protein
MPDATNTFDLLNCAMAPYVKNISIYRCPADVSTGFRTTVYPWGGPGNPRVRSISMNSWLDGPIMYMNPGTNAHIFFKTTDITKPANLFVFIDENPASIDDGFFWTMISDSDWEDIPATYHNNACGMSFADSHAIIKAWHDNAILGMNAHIGAAPQQHPPIDLMFMQSVATY